MKYDNRIRAGQQNMFFLPRITLANSRYDTSVSVTSSHACNRSISTCFGGPFYWKYFSTSRQRDNGGNTSCQTQSPIMKFSSGSAIFSYLWGESTLRSLLLPSKYMARKRLYDPHSVLTWEEPAAWFFFILLIICFPTLMEFTQAAFQYSDHLWFSDPSCSWSEPHVTHHFYL